MRTLQCSQGVSQRLLTQVKCNKSNVLAADPLNSIKQQARLAHRPAGQQYAGSNEKQPLLFGTVPS